MMPQPCAEKREASPKQNLRKQHSTQKIRRQTPEQNQEPRIVTGVHAHAALRLSIGKKGRLP
jgi:hypothetical protein